MKVLLTLSDMQTSYVVVSLMHEMYRKDYNTNVTVSPNLHDHPHELLTGRRVSLHQHVSKYIAVPRKTVYEHHTYP